MEWISIEKKLPKNHGKYIVKLRDENELKAFFYSDMMVWIAYYGERPCYWWDSNYPYDPLYDVTHWREE